MDYSFGICSFDEYWRSTQESVDSYLADNLNEELALICASKLWHMCDWYYEEHKDNLGVKLLSDFQGNCGAESPKLRVIRDVCNGSKHASISKTRTPVLRRAVKKGGAFSSAYSRGFDVTVLEVELVDGSKHYYDDIVREVREYWLQKVEPIQAIKVIQVAIQTSIECQSGT